MVSQFTERQSFERASSPLRTFTWTWTAPAPGTYTIMLGVFDPAQSTFYHLNAQVGANRSM